MVSAQPVQARGGGYGLDAELAQKASDKYDYDMEDEAREWMSTIVGEKITGDFGPALQNGVILCQLVNAIQPGLVKKIETSTKPFPQRENITHFLNACRSLGVKEYQLFETVDLFEFKDLGVVVNCLFALGGTIQSSVPSFKGPKLGIKDAKASARGRLMYVKTITGVTSKLKTHPTNHNVSPYSPMRTDLSPPEREHLTTLKDNTVTCVADDALEVTVRRWMTRHLPSSHMPLSLDLLTDLATGVLLCELVNALQPGLVTKIETSQHVFKQRENIPKFLNACTFLGVQAKDMFELADLITLPDRHRVLGCLHALQQVTQTKQDLIKDIQTETDIQRDASQKCCVVS